MSTATSRPIGDNEFPVLLRLPDLNAPNWPPAVPVAVVTPANAAQPPAADPLPIPTSTPSVSAALSSATAVLSTAVASVMEVTQAETKNETKTKRESATTSTVVAPRLERATRPEPPTAQWTLIRQLATGGVLVGGLALVYFFIMGGNGDPKTPTATDGPLMPTVAETTSPLVVHAENHGSEIPDVPAPPAFGEFKPSAPAPTHIEVAERIDAKPELPPTPPPMNNPLGDVRAELNKDARPEGYVSHGRIGPSNSSNPLPAASPYPTTDPGRYPPIADEPAIRSATRPMYPTTTAPSSLR